MMRRQIREKLGSWKAKFFLASGFVLEGTCMDNNYMIKHSIIYIYIYDIYIYVPQVCIIFL